MPSRVTLWRRKKRLKELLSQRIMTNASLFDENLLDSTSSTISNDNNEEVSHQADSLNHFESQSDFSTSNCYSDVQIAENGSQDVFDAYDDQMWLDERVLNAIDPWENVEIEPIFQYPVLEKEFLFANSSQQIRHRISTKGINDLCKLLKLMKMPNCPINFYRVKRHLLPNASASPSSLTTYICPVCCEASTSPNRCSDVNCTQHTGFRTSPISYLRIPILQQLREILAHTHALNFEQQKSASNIDTMNDIYDAETYQRIIKKEAGKNFLTLLMNVDGIQVAKSSNLSLWIFTLVINEIKRSERFKLKNVIVGGIASTVSKPSRHQMQALLSPIVKELVVLEQGETFKVKCLNENSNIRLKIFLIASCCDKPAQCLVQGISEPIGAFGCGRCELEGETVAVKPNSKKKIRVFPLVPNHQEQPR
ncbi:unnamed protein product [Rotaria socialis]|nr:unnamed protein product [Rotaria socialis]CAF4568850.1 unnamed protein product [Rotaria socialis]